MRHKRRGLRLVHTHLYCLIILSVLLGISSCVSEPQYVPGPEYSSGLTGKSLLEATRSAQQAATHGYRDVGQHNAITDMEIYDEHVISFTFKDPAHNGAFTCHYQIGPAIKYGIRSMVGDRWAAYFKMFLRYDKDERCFAFPTWSASDYSYATSFMNGLTALYYAPAGAYAAAVQNEADTFANAVNMYRRANPKPSLPSDAKMFATQANDAVSRNEKDQAIALYQKALDAASWWPAGHYNLALLLGDQQDYDDAIDEMKKYLQLVPDAADAQKAQQQIWVWQGRVDQGQ